MTQQRIIAFDILRVIMLLLLIVFHAGVSFMETEVEGWFWFDERRNIVFDGAFAFIHAFRHPIFFLISGLVTEQMYQRYSTSEVVKRRVQRLLIPMIIVILIFGSLVNALFAMLNDPSAGISMDTLFNANNPSVPAIHTGYVWFLWYLVIFNSIHFLLIRLKLTTVFRSTGFVIKFFALIAGVLLILLPSGKESMYGDYHFIPAFFSIGSYFLFYIFGISLAHSTKDMDAIKNSGVVHTVLGALSIGVYYYFKISELSSPEEPKTTVTTIFFTLATVMFTFGGLGLALKYYRKQHPLVLYISKGSYFLYLIHFPFNMLFLWIVAPLNLDPLLKFVLIFTPTLSVAFISHYLWNKAWKGRPPI